MSIKKAWTKYWINPYYGFMVVAAFASIISFFQVNSAFADKHHINWLWIVLGVVFALVFVYFGWKANKTSSGQGG